MQMPFFVRAYHIEIEAAEVYFIETFEVVVRVLKLGVAERQCEALAQNVASPAGLQATPVALQ